VVDAGQGYTYSVFNLVYESNTASTKIWDSLGFKRIGRVPGCGNLKSFPEPVDAIIYGRDLKSEEGNVGNEERFDKIRYYLRHSLYPQGADRSEKSRLRSAATHYKLIPAHDGVPEKLMLKDKEVISDPQAQYDIAKDVHLQAHGGINKTTAVIATKYHWVRIKETVSHVIKNCPECKDTNKPPVLRSDGTRSARSKTLDGQTAPADIPIPPTPVKQEGPELQLQAPLLAESVSQPATDQLGLNGHNMPSHAQLPNHEMQNNIPPNQLSLNMTHQQLTDDDYKSDQMDDHLAEHISADDYRAIQQQMGMTHDDNTLSNADSEMLSYDAMALDPQIMEQLQAQIAAQGFENDNTPFSMPPPPHHGMQHFDPNPRPQLQQHPDIHSDPGPHAQFADPSQLQQANVNMNISQNHDPINFSQHQSPTDFSNPSSQYISPVQGPHSMMGHPVPDDHMMSGQLDDTGGGGMNNMQQIRHVLNMEYMNVSDGNGHFHGQGR